MTPLGGGSGLDLVVAFQALQPVPAGPCSTWMARRTLSAGSDLVPQQPFADFVPKPESVGRRFSPGVDAPVPERGADSIAQ